MFYKELVLHKLNYSITKALHYDVQNYWVLDSLINENIIPGVGQWHKDTQELSFGYYNLLQAWLLGKI